MFCVCCQTEKDESEFYKGNKSHCKVCIRERVRLIGRVNLNTTESMTEIDPTKGNVLKRFPSIRTDLERKILKS